MPLKTPAFWSQKDGIACFLRPFSFLYLLGHKIKTWTARPYKSKLPVLCIGGVVAGGSGKTPVVHAIIKLVRENTIFENPVVLTRGYGGTLKGPTTVDLSAHTAADVGDEAMLHATHAPTIVSAGRAQGAMLAEAMGADSIVMDDGLQNNSLAKTMSFLVIDKAQGLGNGYLLPAGPLREPLEEAKAKCAIVIENTNIRVISTHDKDKQYFGFAGLGHPEKFKRTLEENGFHLSGFTPFADHHPYSAHDMDTLIKNAGSAQLITTEKDFVRIPNAFQSQVEVLKIEHEFNNPSEIIGLLKSLRPS